MCCGGFPENFEAVFAIYPTDSDGLAFLVEFISERPLAKVSC